MKLRADNCVEDILVKFNQDLAQYFNANVVFLRAPIEIGLDNIVRDVIEDIANDAELKRGTLVVLIETTGGYIEVVERIYEVFRKNYNKVNFVVPNYAYSAGTVLVLSGDEIYMDYYSVLGPIDPQIQNEEGKVVPGLGYLAKFDELVNKINKSSQPLRAEIAYLLKRFDPATLFLLEQAKNHSTSLLIDWLSRHKFKDWVRTDGTGKVVTEQMRRDRARAIAETLANPERWNSHGRGIGLKHLTGDEIKLKIVDFGSDHDLNKLIRQYYDLFIDFCQKTGARSAIHSVRGLRRIR